MLIISNGVAEQYLAEGLRSLRQKILLHWSEKLAASARLAGEDGCTFVLGEVEDAARADPDLTETDLMMLADLSLVSLASDKRRQQN